MANCRELPEDTGNNTWNRSPCNHMQKLTATHRSQKPAGFLKLTHQACKTSTAHSKIRTLVFSHFSVQVLRRVSDCQRQASLNQFKLAGLPRTA